MKVQIEWHDHSSEKTRVRWAFVDNEEDGRALAERLRQYDDVGIVEVLVDPNTDKSRWMPGFSPRNDRKGYPKI